jgi:sarcosine oxidase
MVYDSIIIGAGLIGSAAAKYLSKYQEKVALIGPDEATALEDGIVFSSHYDQSRIQRIIGKDEVWTLLNQQSVNEYTSLENETNIHFHSGVGCLYVNPYGSDAYLDKVPEQAKKNSHDYQLLQNSGLIHSAFPDFNFPSTSKGMFEASPSGYINPRLLIKAQQNVFQKNGGEIFCDTINDVSYSNEEIKITTITDKIFLAKKVLLAPGAFINFFDLLKRKLVLNLKSETNIWVQVSKEEAQRLSSLPSLLYEIAETEIQNIYLVHPVQYPDGRFYLKMGGNLPGDIFFKNISEIQDWFKSGDNSNNCEILKNELMKLLPSLSIEGCSLRKCIVAFTKHGKPYIGEAEKGFYFISGGNGYSAMCSDALGKIASTLLLENLFPKEFSQNDFQPVFID